jgi:hypothetical protein
MGNPFNGAETPADFQVQLKKLTVGSFKGEKSAFLRKITGAKAPATVE